MPARFVVVQILSTSANPFRHLAAIFCPAPLCIRPVIVFARDAVSGFHIRLAYLAGVWSVAYADIQ
jgi:hypothetical protein